MRMVTNPTRLASEFAKRQTLRAIERTGYSLLKISHDTSESSSIGPAIQPAWGE